MSSLSRGSNRDLCAWPTLAAASVILLALAVVVFVLPAATYTAKVPNDIFGFFDAMHRMRLGQRPHVDFHTALGWLAFALPYLGHSTLDQFGGALEFGNVALFAILLPLAAFALHGRAPTGAAVLLQVALFAVVCVPWPLGESGFVSSQVAYYNRWGWALLTTLLLFGLPTQDAGVRGTLRLSALFAAESAAITTLLFLLFFVKATYFAVGFVFVLVFGVALGRFRQSGSWGLAGLAFVALAMQGSGGWIDDYVRDLLDVLAAVAEPGPEARDKMPTVFDVMYTTTGTLGLVAFACAVAGFLKRLNWQDVLLIAYIMVSSVAIATQNSNDPKILFALLALLVSMAARCPRGTTHRRLVMASMWLVLMPAFCRQLLATVVFLFAAYGGCPDCGSKLPRMEGAWFGGMGGSNAFVDKVTGDAVSARDAFLWVRRNTIHSHMDLSNPEYLHTLRTGLALLKQHGCEKDIVATTDYVNPFPMLLDAPPPKGTMLYMHVGRKINRDLATNRDFVFGDARCLMIPRFPVAIETTELLLDVQAVHLQVAWEQVAGNEHWLLLRRVREPSDVPSSVPSATPEVETV